MSKITDMLNRVCEVNPELGAELIEEFQKERSRRRYGLVYENHQPETIRIPTRTVRKGDMVEVLPARGQVQEDHTLYQVVSVKGKGDDRVAVISDINEDTLQVPTSDLIVVEKVDRSLYPGLKSTGGVFRGGDKPVHSVITSENYHALQLLEHTHHGKVDAIYIDPPYNSGGARDWKYNNDYVSANDSFRHSKWLSMMEGRLSLAKKLLNPDKSVLIVAIDEKEYLNLGILLRQLFPEAKIQMVSTVINRAGSTRSSSFSRTDEYLYFVQLGNSRVNSVVSGEEWMTAEKKSVKNKLLWSSLTRGGGHSGTRKDRPGCFYPIHIKNTSEGPVFHSVGEVFIGDGWQDYVAPEGTVAVFPTAGGKREGRWQTSPDRARDLIKKGIARIGRWNGEHTTIYYLKRGEEKKVTDGIANIIGYRQDGSVIENEMEKSTFIPGTQWNIPSHDASSSGTILLRSFLPDRKFPYPKSLYAVEDALRFFVSDNPNAVIVDFFGGSGTTLHATMRLNAEDGGHRQCILVSNNEVSEEEEKSFTAQGLRPGDPEWDQYGICDYITKPRIQAAVTGVSSTGEPIKGEYKYNNTFTMSDGLSENVHFFTLTYPSRAQVEMNTVYDQIAPVLWMKAGSRGDILDDLSQGYAVSDHYAVLSDMDTVTAFRAEVMEKDPDTLLLLTASDAQFREIATTFPDKEIFTGIRGYLQKFDPR